MIQTPPESLSAVNELRTIGGDELVAELMRTFVQFGEGQVSRLADAAAAGSFEEAANIAHALKSTARQLGALELGDACAAAELAGRGGDAAALDVAATAATIAFTAARPWMRALAVD